MTREDLIEYFKQVGIYSEYVGGEGTNKLYAKHNAYFNGQCAKYSSEYIFPSGGRGSYMWGDGNISINKDMLVAPFAITFTVKKLHSYSHTEFIYRYHKEGYVFGEDDWYRIVNNKHNAKMKRETFTTVMSHGMIVKMSIMGADKNKYEISKENLEKFSQFS